VAARFLHQMNEFGTVAGAAARILFNFRPIPLMTSEMSRNESG
jgi:hypothetical protein